MKKTAISFVVAALCITSLFAGCKKKNQEDTLNKPDTDAIIAELEKEKKDKEKEEQVEKTPEFKVGLYCHEYEEEFGDGIEVFKDYLYFGEDGKGFCIMQDDLNMTYADGTITDEAGNKYSYKMIEDGKLELDSDGYVTEYLYVGKDLTEEVSDEMRHFLDGTLKVNNAEAGFAFEDLITSDTITFYGPNREKGYIAEEDDLESMRACYMELTDNNLPVLFVRTPNAPKEVGYEHILQFIDGKTYDVVGMDKIEAVYKDAGVIATIYEDEEERTTYYYKAGENGELYVFALKDLLSEEYLLYDESLVCSEVSIEEVDKAVEEAIAGSEPVDEIQWKTLDKAL